MTLALGRAALVLVMLLALEEVTFPGGAVTLALGRSPTTGVVVTLLLSLICWRCIDGEGTMSDAHMLKKRPVSLPSCITLTKEEAEMVPGAQRAKRRASKADLCIIVDRFSVEFADQ